MFSHAEEIQYWPSGKEEHQGVSAQSMEGNDGGRYRGGLSEDIFGF